MEPDKTSDIAEDKPRSDDKIQDTAVDKKHSIPHNNHTPIKSINGWVIFVVNIHEEASEDDIRDIFSDYGDVKNIHLNLDLRTGFVKGYALIEYQTEEEAQSAIDNMDGRELLSRKIRVDWAFCDSGGSVSNAAKR